MWMLTVEADCDKTAETIARRGVEVNDDGDNDGLVVDEELGPVVGVVDGASDGDNDGLVVDEELGPVVGVVDGASDGDNDGHGVGELLGSENG
jgi:hypothetical protein